jgi:hypothetical protein
MSGSMADILRSLTGSTAQQQRAVQSLLIPAQAQVPGYDENKGYVDQYNTPLSPEQEQQFQAWLKQRSVQTGRDASKDLYDYDLRGAWLSNAQAAANGHLPDTFKKPNHPTFSNQSQYSTPQTPGGVWTQQPDGKWAFAPSDFNLKMTSPEDLQHYWNQAEPGNKLTLPQAQPDRIVGPGGAPVPVDPSKPQIGPGSSLNPIPLARPAAGTPATNAQPIPTAPSWGATPLTNRT